MNKKQIVRSIFDEYDKSPQLSETQIQYVIDLFLHIVRKKSLTEIVKFHGFGSFGKKKRKRKMGYDFTQKKSIPIDAREVPFFRPCAGFFRGGDDEM